MAKKFLTGLNLVVLDTDPATGSEGELYFNSSASVAKIYQAGAWSVLGAGGGSLTTINNLSDVIITSPLDDQALVYNSSASVWNNANIVNSLYGAGSQIDVSSNNGDITLSFPNSLITPGDLEVTGNLTVSGSTTYINTQTLNVEDNIVTLNSNVTGAPTGTSGIEIERGTELNKSILWSEYDQSWNFDGDIRTYQIRSTDTFAIDVPSSGSANALLDINTDYSQISIDSIGRIVLTAGNGISASAYKFTKDFIEFPDTTQQNTAFLGIASYDTADISEGTNLYFTNERAVDALSSTLSNYLTASAASNSYLTQASASITYQPVGSYLTTETDPVFAASDAFGITSASTSAWNTAYGWGDHAGAGYLTTETDPVFAASDAFGITSASTSAWNTAYGWGDHAGAGYLTTETDPVFAASDAFGITSASTSAWNTAYGWGDHAGAGYAASSHNHTLDSLSNVVITGTPSDGQAIVWDTTTSKWVNETVSGGASYPDQSGNDGKFLQTNSGSVSWQNVDFTGYLTESSASLTYQPIGSYLTPTTSEQVNITNTTQATDSTTGALIVHGGVGVAKDVWIDGNLHVAGTTTTENTKTVATHDNLIYLNAALDSEITGASGDGTYVTYIADNLYTAGMDIRVTEVSPSTFNISSEDLKTVYAATASSFVVESSVTDAYISGGISHAKEEANPDLGFAGGYYDAGYAHAGLFRDASDGVFKFFQGYTPEPDEAVNIDTTHESFSYADISVKRIIPQGIDGNFGIGNDSLYNVTGVNNFGIGRGAFAWSSGYSNYIFGEYAAGGVSGSYNYLFGQYAGQGSNGNYNYAIGIEALAFSTGNNNYAFGENSGKNNDGADNLFLGKYAGSANSIENTGNYNIYIGKSEGLSTSNNIVIADNEGFVRAQYLSASSGWTLGTITSGTWNGTEIGYAYGGTGLTTIGTAGQVLTVNSGATGLEWADASGGSSFTNSSELAALISDETGSGSLVFSNSPTFTGTVSGITNSMVGLGNVEDTALSTWAGSSNITTLGTVTSGTWNGSVIGDSYVNDALTISGGTINNTPIGATTASTGRFTSVNINGVALTETSTGTTSATSSFNTTTHSSAEFIVYGSTSAGNYVSKVMMLARGAATPIITEYAILTQGTAPSVTITPSYSAPNAVLTVAVTSGTNIEIIATEVSI